MPRRRSRYQEPSLLDQFVDGLLTLPWWAGVGLAFLLYASMKWFIPWALLAAATDPPKLNGAELNPAKLVFQPFAHGLRSCAWPAFVVSLCIVAIGRLVSWIRRYSRMQSATFESSIPRPPKAIDAPVSVRQVLDRKGGAKYIGQLSWAEFEELLAVAFRRAGFDVQRTGSSQSDGGIDLILTKVDERTIVQCKHWQVLKVPVSVVREQLGLKQSLRAHHCIIVTSGEFTSDAIKFGSQNGIILLNGAALQLLIEDPTVASLTRMIEWSQLPVAAEDSDSGAPVCPQCGGATTRKVATKGRFKGHPFWACVRFPDCYGRIDASVTE